MDELAPDRGLRCSSVSLDCKQSLFSSKIRGKERKTGKRANVTASA